MSSTKRSKKPKPKPKPDAPGDADKMVVDVTLDSGHTATRVLPCNDDGDEVAGDDLQIVAQGDAKRRVSSGNEDEAGDNVIDDEKDKMLGELPGEVKIGGVTTRSRRVMSAGNIAKKAEAEIAKKKSQWLPSSTRRQLHHRPPYAQRLELSTACRRRCHGAVASCHRRDQPCASTSEFWPRCDCSRK